MTVHFVQGTVRVIGDKPLSPLKAARRDRLIDVAEAEFLRNGLRAATMEGIAAAAGVSKVTVYGYFRDKDALFAAVATRLAARLHAVFDAALAGRGSVADRVTAALVVKHDLVFGLVRASPHAAELMAARQTVSAIFNDLDAGMTAAIALLAGDAQAARIVFDGATGIAEVATSREQLADDIARLVRALLG
jgi:AcrR family transcriptional regulator